MILCMLLETTKEKKKKGGGLSSSLSWDKGLQRSQSRQVKFLLKEKNMFHSSVVETFKNFYCQVLVSAYCK